MHCVSVAACTATNKIRDLPAAPEIRTPRSQISMQSALVITLARCYVQVRTPHAHFDAVIILAAVGILRLKRDGVLIAGLFGDGSIEIFQAAILPGVKSVAARGRGISLQPGTFLLHEGVADGNRINRDVGLEQELQSLVERVFVSARIISVGNQEHNFASIAAAALEHFARGVNGVVEVLILFLLLYAQGRGRSGFERTSIGGRARGQRATDGRAGIMRTQVESLELSEKEIVV